MTLHLRRLGKRRVRTLDYALPARPATLRALIAACVRVEVDRYNIGQLDAEVLPYLLPADIGAQAPTGKVTTGEVAEPGFAEAETAIERAVLAWEDGLFVVFVDGGEVRELDGPLELTGESEVAFLRMTFLAGRAGH